MARGPMNYAVALLLILIGIRLNSWGPEFPTVWTPALALPLIVAGLLWGGLALNKPLRERGSHPRSRDGSLRVVPAPGAGYRRHRSPRHAPARRFAADNLLRTHGTGGEMWGDAMNASATAALGSALRGSLRIAAEEAKKNLYGARVSMWAVLSAIVLALTSSDLLLTGGEISPTDQSEALHILTSLTVGLGLLLTGLLAADSVSGEKGRETLRSTLLIPIRRGALPGKVLGVMAAWLLIYMISVPFILVVGFGTGVLWVALIYTLFLGTLCVAGFAALTVGLGALSRTERGVTPVFLAIFLATTAPTLLETALRKSWFGDIYNALNPIAQARLSLEGMIVDNEGLLVQPPHIGALMAFALITGTFAAVAARGVSPGGDERHGRGRALKPWHSRRTTAPAEQTGTRLADPGAEESVRP